MGQQFLDRISRMMGGAQEALDAKAAKRKEDEKARRARVEPEERPLTNMADDNISPAPPQKTARDMERAKLRSYLLYGKRQMYLWARQVPKLLHQAYRGVCIALSIERIYRLN